jgi:putative ABC transport system permease protein
MLKATLRSLFAHKIRMALTGVAIVLGVAFVAGTLVFTDTLSRTFDKFFAAVSSDVTVTKHSEFDSGENASPTTLPASVVDAARSVPGVAKAEGSILVDGVDIVNKSGDGVLGAPGAPHFGANWTDPNSNESGSVRIVEGKPPASVDQVVVDAITAKNEKLKVGDRLSLVTPSKDTPHLDATLVGVFDYKSSQGIGGATVAVFDDQTAQRLLTGPGLFTSVEVTGEPGVSDAALAGRVKQAVGAEYDVKTAAQTAADASAEIRQGLSFINTFLLVFAAIALFVGIFLILNTFSMLVAQRTRELALLRAVGASRRQVTGSVLGEAFVVGLVGSTVGLGLGFGLALLLKALFEQLGLELTGAKLVFEPRTAIVAYVVGILVTMTAAYFPARRAARIPPVAALRDDVALPESSLRLRLVVGSALTVIGAIALGLGLAGGKIQAVGLGVLLVMIGVILLTPLIARRVVGALGTPFAKVYGPVGKLARENALRNPRRTSVTASALMIGLALVAALATLGASAKKSTDALVDNSMKAGYTVQSSSFTGFSPRIADSLAAVQGVDLVAREQYRQAKVDGKDVQVSGFDPGTLNAVLNLTFKEGSADGLQGDGMLIDDDKAKKEKLAIGDSVTVRMLSGSQQVKVAGIFKHVPFESGYMLPTDLVKQLSGDQRDSFLYVKTAPGVDVRPALDAAVRPYPNVELENQQEFKDQISGSLDQLLYVMYALLALAIVIAAVGIVNTLALSVYERTREVGLLRAVGLGRRQLRRMVRIESVVISVFGAVLGMALGVILGLALLAGLADEGLDKISVPWATPWYGSLVTFVLVAVVIGVLAAIWPARRASRLDVIEAITTE